MSEWVHLGANPKTIVRQKRLKKGDTGGPPPAQKHISS